MSEGMCAEIGCEKASRSRGYCNPHYHRRRRAGEFERRTDEQRFWLRVDKRGQDECWPWLRYINIEGYAGTFYLGGRNRSARQASYELAHGPLPDGLEVDRVCHSIDPTCPGGVVCAHRRCVNPAHLEAVSRAENHRRIRARTQPDATREMSNP